MKLGLLASGSIFMPRMSAFSMLYYLLISLSLLQQAVAHDEFQHGPNSPAPKCHTTFQRREWRTLSTKQKTNYIDAVLCLQHLPAANAQDNVAQSRFDEFQGLHVRLADEVHSVGHFLPWHRYFLIRYEIALREECGYEGAHPYWNWSIDADSHDPITKSPIFDTRSGFGGDGVAGTYDIPEDTDGTSNIHPDAIHGCVTDGPFASLRLRYGPGKFVGDHCLTRGIRNSMLKELLNSNAVATALAQPSFELFRIEIEGQPEAPTAKTHDGGHIGIGGEMSNIYSSPGDPLFFLHHANLDRIWRKWQLSKPGRM